MTKKLVANAKSEEDNQTTKVDNDPIALSLEKRFKLIREQIQHEDGLIHEVDKTL